MKLKKYISPVAITFFVLFFVFSCGGSSKSDRSFEEPLAINADNVIRLANLGIYSYGTSRNQLLSAIESFDFGGNDDGAIAPIERPAVLNRTIDCDVSGTRTLIFTPEDQPADDAQFLIPGDNITLDFDDCDMGNNIFLSGRQNIQIQSLEGDGITVPFR